MVHAVGSIACSRALKRPLPAAPASAPSITGPSPSSCSSGVIAGDRAHVHDDAEGARAGGGPGHPLHPGQDAAIRQSRLSRGRDPAALPRSSAPCPRRSTSSPSTAWATCIRLSPASCSSRGASGRAIRRRCCRSCQPRISSLPTALALSFSPPALPGLDRRTAGAVRHHHHARLPRARRRARRRREVGARERPVHLLRLRPPLRDAADRVPDRSRQGQPARHHHGRYRRLARHAARRQLRQPVRSLRPQLPGHPAGAARVPAERGLADALSDPHERRHPGAALQRRDGDEDGAAERAHQFPAAQFGDAFGACRSRAARSARPSTS